MAVLARPLIIGVAAAVFLALLLHPFIQLPPSTSAEHSHRSTHTPTALLSPVDYMASLLKNTLQIASQAARAAGAYKSARLAAPVLQHTAPSSLASSSSIPSFSSSTVSTRAFSSTTSKMASSKSFLDAVKDRRTYYQLNKEAPISDKAIVDIVKTAVLHVPSSFNSQSTRVVVLLNKEHEQFWDITKDVLKAIVPAEQFGTTEQKINGFKAGYGSILFFEDPEPVEALRKAFPLYAHHFGDWSEHTNAMHQYALWVALEAEGFGANLQHYNPIVDQRVQEQWNVPKEWKLRSQLVFGGRAGEPGEKEFKPLEGTRLFVHGAKE